VEFRKLVIAAFLTGLGCSVAVGHEAQDYAGLWWVSPAMPQAIIRHMFIAEAIVVNNTPIYEHAKTGLRATKDLNFIRGQSPFQIASQVSDPAGAYSSAEGCTNQAESFFSRLRRAEIGTHHHIAGPYLAAYAAEMDWREDNRRESNGAQYSAILAAAAKHPISRQWKGYWQRRAA
jgi:hypothetical protein